MDAPGEDSRSSGKLLDVEKPPTLDATKVAPETSMPPSLSGTQCSPSPTATLDPATALSPDLNAADMPPR
jgi:hypothetical protein